MVSISNLPDPLAPMQTVNVMVVMLVAVADAYDVAAVASVAYDCDVNSSRDIIWNELFHPRIHRTSKRAEVARDSARQQ